MSKMSDISKHIGKRIRLYRKNKQMTQEDLAKLLYKGKAVVSKYERGEISIDIDTLYEIAAVLNIDVRQLLDMPGEKRMTPPVMMHGFFAAGTRFYTYYINKNSSRIVPGVLELNRNEHGEYATVLYVDVLDYENLFRCRHLYYGDIHYSDSFVNLVLQNQDNAAERIFINICNTFGQGTVTVGMISGTSSKYMVPIAMKILLSQQQLPQDDKLHKMLEFDREDIALMKRARCFCVDRLFEYLND